MIKNLKVLTKKHPIISLKSKNKIEQEEEEEENFLKKSFLIEVNLENEEDEFPF